jgi:hypothetical protein
MAWLSGYSYRKAFTIDQTKVSADLTNFPVLIKLTDDSDLGIHALSSGFDIAFTSSDGVSLSYERESFSISNGLCNAIFWVKTDLSHTVNTTIYLYYGNSNATDGENKTGVWDSNYVGVWHLSELGTGVLADFLDSTSNNNDSISTTSQPSRIAGLFGYGQNFDGTKYLELTDSASLRPSAQYTVSLFINFNSVATTQAILFLHWGDFQLMLVNGVIASTTGGGSVTSTITISAGNWYYINCVWDGVRKRIYINDNPDTNAEGWNIGWSGGEHPPVIGATGSPYYNRLNAVVDEIHISNTARSVDWLATEYANQNDPDNFIEIGEETPVWLSDYGYRKLITLDHTKVSGNLENFPVLIKIESDSDLGTYITDQTNSYDIRFTLENSLDVLDYEIESFSISNGQYSGVFWVRIPSLSSTTDTKLHVYFGKSGDTSGQNVTGVWDSNFRGVWHFADDPTVSSPQITNSVTNTKTGSVSVSAPTSITGLIGKAFNFNYTNSQYISAPFSTTYGPFTLTCITRPAVASTSYRTMFSHHSGANNGWNFQINSNHSLSYQLPGNDYHYFGDSQHAIQDVWQYITLTAVGNHQTCTLYHGLIGQSMYSTGLGYNVDAMVGTPNQIQIGRSYAGEYFNGDICEIRISSVIRSSQWINTEFNNINSPSTFIKSIGTLEELIQEPTSVIKSFSSTNDIYYIKSYTNLNDIKLNRQLNSSNDINFNKQFSSSNDLNYIKAITNSNDLRINRQLSSSNDLNYIKAITNLNDIRINRQLSSSNDLNYIKAITNLNDIIINRQLGSANDILYIKSLGNSNEIILVRQLSSTNDLNYIKSFGNSNDIKLNKQFGSANDIGLIKQLQTINDIKIDKALENFNDIKINKVFENFNDIKLIKLIESINDIHIYKAFESINEVICIITGVQKALSSSNDILFSKQFSNINDIKINRLSESSNDVRFNKGFGSSNDVRFNKGFESSNDVRFNKGFESSNDIRFYKLLGSYNDIRFNKGFGSSNDIKIYRSLESTNDINVNLVRAFSNTNDILIEKEIANSNDVHISKLLDSVNDVIANLVKSFSSSNDVLIRKQFSSSNDIHISKIFESSNDVVIIAQTINFKNVTFIINKTTKTVTIVNVDRKVSVSYL